MMNFISIPSNVLSPKGKNRRFPGASRQSLLFLFLKVIILCCAFGEVWLHSPEPDIKNINKNFKTETS